MATVRTQALNCRHIGVAVTLALLAQAAVFTLMLLDSGRLPALWGATEPPIEMWLAPPVVRQPPATHPATQFLSPPARARAAVAPEAADRIPGLPPTPAGAGPAARTAAVAGGGVAASMRGTVGCAQPTAAWMSDADRADCLHGLAAGAAGAPHVEGMAPEKHAYYAAIAKTQADWLSGRDPGHLPFPYCGVFWGPGAPPKPPPHALTIGSHCFIEPPRGSLDKDVDVRPIGEARDPADATSAPAHPWINHNILRQGRRPAADPY